MEEDNVNSKGIGDACDAFDYDKARAGARVETARGEEVRVASWESPDPRYPIVALVGPDMEPMKFTREGTPECAFPGNELRLAVELDGRESAVRDILAHVLGVWAEDIRPDLVKEATGRLAVLFASQTPPGGPQAWGPEWGPEDDSPQVWGAWGPEDDSLRSDALGYLSAGPGDESHTIPEVKRWLRDLPERMRLAAHVARQEGFDKGAAAQADLDRRLCGGFGPGRA